MSQGYLYDEGNDLITRKESSGGLPDPSEASAGDVLSLNEDKEPVWSAPSGGGGGTIILEKDDSTTDIQVEGQTVPVYMYHVKGTTSHVKYSDVANNPDYCIFIEDQGDFVICRPVYLTSGVTGPSIEFVGGNTRAITYALTEHDNLFADPSEW